MIPSFFQYNPFLRYVESLNNELLCTSASGIPLIRFSTGDRGQIIPSSKIETLLAQTLPKWKSSLKKVDWQYIPWQLPFLAFLGRSDYALDFHLANVRPEYIRHALDHKPFFGQLTGKFVIRKHYKKNMTQVLEINIELRKGIAQTSYLRKALQTRIIQELLRSDYRYEYVYSVKSALEPRVKLWPYQDKTYFKLGTKPNYILRDV